MRAPQSPHKSRTHRRPSLAPQDSAQRRPLTKSICLTPSAQHPPEIDFFALPTAPFQTAQSQRSACSSEPLFCADSFSQPVSPFSLESEVGFSRSNENDGFELGPRWE